MRAMNTVDLPRPVADGGGGHRADAQAGSDFTALVKDVRAAGLLDRRLVS
jgi:hypothetical protein